MVASLREKREEAPLFLDTLFCTACRVISIIPRLKFCLKAMANPDIPYWRANVPEDQWPTECPEFLLNLSERDEKLVSRLDKDYRRLTWPEVKEVIGNVKPVMLQSVN